MTGQFVEADTIEEALKLAWEGVPPGTEEIELDPVAGSKNRYRVGVPRQVKKQSVSRELSNRIADALGLPKEISRMVLTLDWQQQSFSVEYNQILNPADAEKIATAIEAEAGGNDP